MAFFVFMTILLFTGVIGLAKFGSTAKGKILVGVVALFLASFGTVFTSDFYVVAEAGEVVVYRDLFRGVLDRVDGVGFHFKLPIIQKAQKFIVRTQAYTMSIAAEEGSHYGDDSLQAKTSDGQDVWVDVTVFFRLEPEQTPNLWQSVGEDYVDVVIRPNTRGEVRLVIAGYTAEGLYSAEQRADAQQKMYEVLGPIFAEKGIILERVTLRNVNFTRAFSDAVEAKQVEFQGIQKALYELERIEIEKQQKIVEAQGDAEAIRLRGETLRANPAVIQYEFVQKMSPSVKWGILPGDTIPFLDFKNIME